MWSFGLLEVFHYESIGHMALQAQPLLLYINPLAS
jgi:hypothetical protein